MGWFGPTGDTSTKPSLPKFAKPAYLPFRDYSIEAFGKTKDIGPFTGKYVADVDPLQTQALGGLEDIARGRMADNPGNLIVNSAKGYLDPNYLNVGTDPTFLNALQAMTNPLNENRMDQLNRARAVAAGSGADLGDRAALQEGSINTDVNRVMSDMVAKATLDELTRREGIQTQVAPEMLAAGLGLQETPSRLLGEVGGTRRAFEQETVVQPELLKFQEQLQSILRPQVPFQNFFGSVGLPYGQTTSTGTGGEGMQLIQSLLGGATMGMMGGK